MVQLNINRVVRLPRRLPDRILFLWGASVVVTIITFFIVQFKLRPHGDFSAALHYNVLIGVDSFGSAASVYAIPLASLFIIALNAFLYRSVVRHERFLGFLTSLVSLIVAVVLCSAALFLLRVN